MRNAKAKFGGVCLEVWNDFESSPAAMSIWVVGLLGVLLLSGCVFTDAGLMLAEELPYLTPADGVAPVVQAAARSQVEPLPAPVQSDEGEHAFAFVHPISSEGYRDISLDEVIRFALANSTVLRDLGGRLIQAPVLTPTIYGPSIQATDPRFGIEGALSEFDAQFTTRSFFEKNDRVLNNELLGGGVNFYRQNLWRTQSEISKKAATGTEIFLRHNVENDLNNATRNLFERAWTWNLETEVRQPLLQGSGVLFNRIAGRSDSPGIANGVMIARVNTSISETDFQLAIRDFVSNVENAYWDLYFSYRDLQAKKKSRGRSLETLRNLKGRRDITDDDKLEQALEQYYRVQEEVENARSGRLVEGSRSFNGSGGGSFQSAGGVRVAERRLRLLIGLPLEDGAILRPITDPPSAKVILDPAEAAAQAVQQRAELRAQQLRIKRRQLELFADQNYARPELDLVARYRWRGLGDNLYDPNAPDFGASRRSNTHEWLVGAEFSQPLGFRQARSAMRNSKLRLARDRALLAEMERQVIHDIQNAVSNADRAYRVVQIAFNRRGSAQKRYVLLTDKDRLEAKAPDFILILDADRRLLEAEVSYHRARVEYALAIKNVQFEMGSLLDYCNVRLSDDKMPVERLMQSVAQVSSRTVSSN